MHRLRLACRLGAITATLGLLAACVMPPPLPPSPSDVTRAGTPAESENLPQAIAYDLGEATIVQERFPADSRFRSMPVRLNGLIAAPHRGQGPFPVIVILHGTHPGCPVIDHVDRWPCDPADERPNYRGFGYLVEHLAANGYVALSININAENTFGFGEGTPGERITQIVDKHLRALSLASSGGANQFGLDLKGKADMRRLAFAGHSRGGDDALTLTQSPVLAAAAADPAGYGPVSAILMIAPSPGFADPVSGVPVPLAVLLPMCDGDVVDQAGQVFYEAVRLAPGQRAWATSAFLERANHNAFNATLDSDPFGVRGRPDCATLLDPEAQQAFLADYALDFFNAALAGETSPDKRANGRELVGLGIDPRVLAPSELYGRPARVASLPSAVDRAAVFTPQNEGELTTNRLGGAVVADGVKTFFCEAGSYTPFMKPGTEPCRRTTVTIPGNPALAIVSWDKPGGALRFAIPPGKGDLSTATAITLRAALDPLSPLNAAGASQSFSIRVTDAAGKTAKIATRPDEPALRYPAGEVEMDTLFGEMFTGRLPLTVVRVPVSALQGVDKTDIREIALLFDQAPSGSLFLADLEWVRTAGD
jgi:hypothetical protein